MSQTIQIVNNGAVINTIVVEGTATIAPDGLSASWSGVSAFPAPEGCSFMSVSGASIGWVVSGGTLVAPAQPAAPPPTPADLTAYAAAKRFAVETGGITVNGAQIATDRDSQSMISNAWTLLQASGGTSVQFKTVSGFVTLTADQFKAMALAVGAHVQACFNEEATVDAAITAGTITTMAAIDAAFATITA